MKWITHPVVTALSLTNLLLLFLTSPLTSSSHPVATHWSGPISPIFLPVLIVFGLCWLTLTLLLMLSTRSRLWRLGFWSAIIVLVARVFAKEWASANGKEMPHWPQQAALFAVVVALILLVSPWQRPTRVFLGRLLQVTLLTIGFGALGAILTLVQMAWNSWEARDLDWRAPLQPVSVSVKPKGPPILWIVLDELSYQQIFETRYEGLKLPEFDELARQATVFTHVVPVDIKTINVLPSLMTGERVRTLGSSADGRLLELQDAATKDRIIFHPDRTVFRDASEAGYQTSIAGWYIPYCRILQSVLNGCFQQEKVDFNGMVPNMAISANLKGIFRDFFSAATRKFLPSPSLDSEVELHQEDYVSLMQASDKVLAKPELDFVLLHLPIPHPVGIYDRNTHAFSTHRSTYIDNLALADVTLGHIRDVLQSRGRWDTTTVIVMGDHSWRTNFMWRRDPAWTKEEEIASHGGKFDERPGYIVKLPGQQMGARIDTRFGAIYTRAMLDEIMHGKIRTPEELAAWVKEQPQVDSPGVPQ